MQYLQVLLPVVHNMFCFDLPVLDIHLVATQHGGDVLTDMLQISMPHGDILVG